MVSAYKMDFWLIGLVGFITRLGSCNLVLYFLLGSLFGIWVFLLGWSLPIFIWLKCLHWLQNKFMFDIVRIIPL